MIFMGHPLNSDLYGNDTHFDFQRQYTGQGLVYSLLGNGAVFDSLQYGGDLHRVGGATQKITSCQYSRYRRGLVTRVLSNGPHVQRVGHDDTVKAHLRP